MNMKKTLLTIAMMMFMVFTISGVTEQSYAYWASNVAPPTVSTTTGTIGVGSWTVVYPQWDPNASYVIGDRVTNNGGVYEATKNNPRKEPGVDSGWTSQWIQIS